MTETNIHVMGAREFETSNVMDLPRFARPLGPRHFPTPHRTSAVAMVQAIEGAGLTIHEQTHVVDGLRTMGKGRGNYGDVTVPQAHLFSLYRVSYGQSDNLLIGYRNSIAQSMAMRCCVGKYFPICTNVSLFGDDIVFSRKNTLNADIFSLASESVRDKVLPLFRTMEEQIETMRESVYRTTAERRSETLGLFEDGTLPAKLIQPMARLWDAMADDNRQAAPEVWSDQWNRLGLMQACTRLTNDLPTRRKAEASQKISRHFGFGLLPLQGDL